VVFQRPEHLDVVEHPAVPHPPELIPAQLHGTVDLGGIVDDRGRAADLDRPQFAARRGHPAEALEVPRSADLGVAARP
jgi:hypothetical protein